MPQDNLKQDLSNCCSAPTFTDCSDEGTCCYICSKCHNPCDIPYDWDKPNQEEYNMEVRTFDDILWVRKADFDFLLTSERAKVLDEIEKEVGELKQYYKGNQEGPLILSVRALEIIRKYKK